jgi:hypothetical protein
MRCDVEIGDRDAMRWVTRLAAAGVVAAAVLAIIGGFPLDTPMPTHAFGWVEPTCGLTRGSTAIARGDFATAWHYNPVSFLVMGFGLAGLVRTAVGLTMHRWVNVKVTWSRAAWVGFGTAVVAFWLYQQTNADFIINARG